VTGRDSHEAGTDRGATSAARSGRWEVKLYQGGFVVDAESAQEARVEALQAVAESLDLFVVRELPTEGSLPTVEEVQGILRDA